MVNRVALERCGVGHPPSGAHLGHRDGCKQKEESSATQLFIAHCLRPQAMMFLGSTKVAVSGLFLRHKGNSDSLHYKM